MFSSLKWTIYILFIYILFVNGEIENVKICANEECTEPISYAKTMIKYASSKNDVMSFGLNEDVVVYTKYKGIKNEFWTVKINEKKGDVPKQFIRESRVVAKKIFELPLKTGNVKDDLKSKVEVSSSANESEKKSELVTEKGSAAEDFKSKDESTSDSFNSNLMKNLSPSRVLQQTTVELNPSITLDNIVEYTEQKANLASEPAQSSAWFPETPNVVETKIDNNPKSSKLNDPSLVPSLTVEESTHKKYLIIDGTSIIDDEPESSVLSEQRLKSSNVEDFDFQVTSTQIDSSIGQMFSSAVEYYPSSSLSSSLETSTVSFNTLSSETSIEKEKEKVQETSNDENLEESKTGGWFSGISDLFSVGDIESTDINQDTTSATLDKLEAESTKVVEEPNINTIVESENDKIVDEQNKISDDDLTNVDDELNEDDEIDEVDEKSYSSRNLLSKELELDEGDEVLSDDFSDDEELNKTVKHIELQTENSRVAIDSDDQVNNLTTDISKSSLNTSELLKNSSNSENIEMLQLYEKSIDSKLLSEVVIGDKEKNVLLNDNSQAKEDSNIISSVKNLEEKIEIDTSEVKVEDDASSVKTREEKLKDDVVALKTSEEKNENDIASAKTLEEEIENDIASIKSLDEKIENDLLSGEISKESEVNKDAIVEEVLKDEYLHVDEVIREIPENKEIKIENSLKGEENYSDKYDEQNAEQQIASTFISSSEDDKGIDPLKSEDDSTIESEYKTSETNNWNEEMSNKNSENPHSDVHKHEQHVYTDSNLDNCDINEDGYCNRKVENDLTDKKLYFESELDEEDAQYGFVDQFKNILDMILKWLPDPILEYLHELEALGVSPKVVTLTVIVGIFVFILEISYLALKKRFKEKSYLTKLGNLDKKLFSAVTERDELRQELVTLKQMTENSYVEFSDSQKIIDEIQQELDFSRTSNAKLQDAVTSLQDQLESQQNIINSLQLQEETTKQINLQHKDELEVLKLEKVTLEALTEDLTINQKELLLAKDNLTIENDAKSQQIDYLKQNNAQLLKESEEWDQSVQQLQITVNAYQSQIQDLTDELSVKSNDLTLTKEFLAKLKFSKGGTNSEDDENEEALVLNADVILQQMSDVSNVKAELSTVREERDSFKEQFLIEHEARTAAEESIKEYSSENHNLKIEYSKANQERVEAKTKLDVLSNYFKDKEMQLQKELGLQEAMRQQSQENVSSVTHRIATYEQEAELNRLQVSTLKTEIENQEKSFRSQLMVQEKKAHENWIAARVAERKLEQIKQESAILRNKLTLMELEKKEHMDEKLNAKKLNSSNNGEVMSPQNALQPEDRSNSMDLPTSGSSSLFREPIVPDPRLPFLPIDRPLPPPMPPFLHPMQMMPPPHLLPMNHPVPLMPPHFMGPRRPPPPMDMWMTDRPRHSPPFDHSMNRERRTPPALAHQRSPPPYEERQSSPSTISGDRRGDEMYSREAYREQTPPSRYSDQSGPPNHTTDNIPPHLRRYKLDNGSVNSRKSSPIVKRNNDNLPTV